MRTLPAVLVAVLISATSATAQSRDRLPSPQTYAGIVGHYAQPVGEFGDQVGGGYGLDASFLYRVDRAALFGLRIEGGFLEYGREERPVMISPTIGGRILVDLSTTNSVLFLTAGPQLMLPDGRFRPYLNAGAGLAYFTTGSSLRPDAGESFATTTNYDDLTFTYGGAAGLYVPLHRGRQPVSLDLGMHYRHTPEVSYLREGSIRDLPDGTIEFDPIVSETDLFEFRVGVTVGLRKSEREMRRRGR